LSGKVGLVTGAAVGLGRALAKELAKREVKVALCDINLDGLQQTLEDIQELGGEGALYVVDLLDVQEIERAVQAVAARWGGVDIVANIAGLWHDKQGTFIGRLLHEIPTEEIDALIGVNLKAPMFVARASIPGMLERRRGKIINISGSFPEGGFSQVHYYVSKKGVEIFTQAVAPELRKHNVQIYCISPGDFDSEWFRKLVPEYLDTCIKMEDVVGLAMFLLEDPAADQITGEVIAIGDHWTQWDVGQHE
ncbi:MAG: SDR family NAD(P)-dependent oxidoreductase, partial [Candidatus Hermodarchaeia archaeon]